jgi:hypothetical protein
LALEIALQAYIERENGELLGAACGMKRGTGPMLEVGALRVEH